MEMLDRSSSVRCRGLLPMQRHVFVRYAQIENYLRESWYINIHEQVATLLLPIGYNCHNFLVRHLPAFRRDGQPALSRRITGVSGVRKGDDQTSFDEIR